MFFPRASDCCFLPIVVVGVTLRCLGVTRCFVLAVHAVLPLGLVGLEAVLYKWV